MDKQVAVDQKQALPGAELATGGGNATAAGVTFQGALGASFAAAAIADRPVDARLGIGAVRIRELRFETEAPLDDILVATNADGYVFTQPKTSLLSRKNSIVNLARLPSRSFGNGGFALAGTGASVGIGRSCAVAICS